MVHGPLEATAVAWTLIDDHAHHTPGDGRTVEQRRFDAFTDLFLGTRAWDAVRPTIEVTVPLDTLLGGDTGAVTACGSRSYPPGQLAQLLTDPAEAPPPTEFQYRPSAALVRASTGPVLSVPRLSPQGPPQRPRPHHRLAGRPDRRAQPDNAVHAASPVETRDRLDPDSQSRRLHHLDQPHRTSLHHLAA